MVIDIVKNLKTVKSELHCNVVFVRNFIFHPCDFVINWSQTPNALTVYRMQTTNCFEKIFICSIINLEIK